MILHAVRRSWQIYVAFLLLLIVYLVLVQNLGNVRYLDETNTAVFFEHPGAAIIHASLMQYKPVNIDILPLFVLLHLAFPALLCLFRRSTRVALATSVLLYIYVQIFGSNLQGWPRGECTSIHWHGRYSSWLACGVRALIQRNYRLWSDRAVRWPAPSCTSHSA